MYGWAVASVRALAAPAPLPRMRRRHRSLFSVLRE